MAKTSNLNKVAIKVQHKTPMKECLSSKRKTHMNQEKETQLMVKKNKLQSTKLKVWEKKSSNSMDNVTEGLILQFKLLKATTTQLFFSLIFCLKRYKKNSSNWEMRLETLQNFVILWCLWTLNWKKLVSKWRSTIWVRV